MWAYGVFVCVCMCVLYEAVLVLLAELLEGLIDGDEHLGRHHLLVQLDHAARP